MVIKGGSRGGAGGLAAHLLRVDTNERAEVLELHGVIADRLPEALAEMEAVATGTRCRKSLYHASINTGPGEELTWQQKAEAVARLELALGLEGHARAVVEHRKEGRDHLHVVWSRIDVDTMRATHDGHNYRKHEAVARELEREFGHNRVQGVHVERDGPAGDRTPRPPRTPSSGDVQQATRTKRGLGDVGADLTRLWRAADTGPAFAAALEEAGYVLAQGDRRGFVVIDQAGGVHSLARRIEGAKTKDVNARLAGVELASLPTVDEGRAMQKDPEAERRQQEEAERYYRREEIRRGVDADFHAQGLGSPPIERPTSPPANDRQAERDREPTATITHDQVAELIASQGPHSNIAEFVVGVRKAGFLPVRDERGGLCIVDRTGAILGVTSERSNGKTVSPRMWGLDPTSLPTVDQARTMQWDRQAERDPRTEKPTQDPVRVFTPERPEQEAHREAERAPAQEEPPRTSERAQPPPERRDGPDYQQQLADSAESRRERVEASQAADNRPATRSTVKPQAVKEAGRAIRQGGGLLGRGMGKAAGGLLGIFGKLLGAAAGTVDQATKSQPTRSAAPAAPAARPQPRPAPPPAPRPPSVFDEIQAKIREQEAQGGKAAAPTRQPEKDRGRGMEFRPIVRLAATFGMDTTWIAEAKRRLIAYSERTGMATIKEVTELQIILYRALHGPA